jgi:nucleoside-diphosphate-sugar epimerase
MKIVIIGGTGHVGTYLVPRLVAENHEVVSVTRNQRTPYHQNPAWNFVNEITIDREAAEKAQIFGKQILDLKPDVVIDMICFTPESAAHLANALIGNVTHFLHCGTTWVHGHSTMVPTTEAQRRDPFGNYGIEKAAIEKYLLKLCRDTDFPVTILHPGHIVGPGWVPVNPAGNFNAEVYKKLMSEEELSLPNLGMETLHHVHADDVAAAFVCALNNKEKAVGESFHVVSAQAVTLRGYAEALAGHFGKKARLNFLPWEDWKKTVSEEDADATWDHIAHSPNCSIEKARRLLGYNPRYSSLEAVTESLDWLKSQGRL